MNRKVLSTKLIYAGLTHKIYEDDLGDGYTKQTTIYHGHLVGTRLIAYYLNGDLHCKDGPALVIYDIDNSIIDQEWWLLGRCPTEEEIAEIRWNIKFDETLEEVLDG